MPQPPLLPPEGKERVKIDALHVNTEYENLLPPLTDEDYKNLEKSILKDGVIHPFIVNPDNVVLDGHHRLRICKSHSICEVPFIERSFKTDLEEEEFVISFNLNRRHLSTIQKVELGLSILKIEMEKARRRQLSQLTHVKDSVVPLNSEERDEEQGEAIEIVAKKVGLGKDTLWKAKQILDAAEEDEKMAEAWQKLSEGKGSIHSVFQELHPKEDAFPINSQIEGVFQVVVIDPPRFKIDELKRMSIPFDDKNCVVWLWTPVKSFCDAFSLLHSWGFQVQTMLTWMKNKKRKGDWLRNQTEHCIFATKGTPHVTLDYHSTALIAAPGKHNPKPDEFFSLVSSLCVGRKLTFFYGYPNWEGPLAEVDVHVSH